MMVMLLFTALASFVALATEVAADPSGHSDSHYRRYQSGLTARMPLMKHTPSQYNPVQSNRRRFTRSNSAENTAELNMTNNDNWFYSTKIGVGVPPTYYNLWVDTGSSNTWVGANTPYVQTSTSTETSYLVEQHYGSSYFKGHLFNDTVTIAPGVNASNQLIGSAFNSSGISPGDGVLGIGPSDLTVGTVSSPLDRTAISTVTDSLFAQGTIQQYLVAVSFEPTASKSDVNGELTFGATDPTKYIGNISYSPITTNVNASKYWGIDASIQYGGSKGSDSVVLSNTKAGIVDTGSSLISLSAAAYKTYINATGAVLDSGSSMLLIDETQYNKLQSLNFVIGGETFELTPDAQIWPRALNSIISGGNKNSIYLAVTEMGHEFPDGVDFILGMPFLERFYSVFDSGSRRIGLARTPFTNATTNW